ncbi:PAS domain S-box protein [uncultured Thiodictyon sp.]|jgi:PAS domain S-box-containing protein|uniref:PAS domain S-box protein n=1 Tax=uncultured Thiodictyon sp. TaxID=1846217 RepID=UPI0025F1BCF3|nr:PAS domain S-box protein [uncultured Thiodictyon sp.]
MIETLTLATLCQAQCPLVLAPEDPVSLAVAVMGERRLSSVVILDGDTPVGLFTERDALGLIATGTYNPATPLRALMSADLVTAPPEMTFIDGYARMAGHGVRHLVLTDAAGRLYGVLSETDFARALGVAELHGPRTVADLMTGEPATVPPGTSIAECLALMADRRISSVIVAEGERALGILTERDAIRLATLDLDLQTTPVSAVMSQPVQIIGSEAFAYEAATRMRAAGVRHLAVADGAGRLVGILTRKNLLRDIHDVHLRLLRQSIAKQGQALRDTRQQLRDQDLMRAMFEASPAGISLRDRDGRLVLVNPALLAMLGYQGELPSVIGHHFSEFVMTADQEQETLMFARLLDGDLPSYRRETHYRHRDGHTLVAEVTVTAIRDVGGTLTHALAMVNQDISARKQAQAALQESEERYRGIVNNVMDAIFILDPQGRFLAVNDQACGRYGYDRETFLTLHIRDIHRPDEVVNVPQRLALLLQQEGAATFEAVHRDAQGRPIPVEVSATRSLFGGKPCMLSVVRDISERKRAEAALAEREEQLRIFIEHAPVALAMLDRDLRYLVVSPRWLDDYGLRGRDIIGLSHYEVFPEIPESWREVHRRGLAGEVIRAEDDRFERLDGTVQWLRWEVRPFYQTYKFMRKHE